MVGDYSAQDEYLDEAEYDDDDPAMPEICVRCRDPFIRKTGKLIDELWYCRHCSPQALKEFT